jgi:uncharacterized membrane protein YjjP (DUF1212 family)
MFYRLKFILNDMFISPIKMYPKQLGVGVAFAVLMYIWKADFTVSLISFTLGFMISMLVTISNDSYERQVQSTLQKLKDKE